jgi:hypothetical protein
MALVWIPSATARAQPVDGTVFVRLIGHVRVLRGGDERWREQLLNLRDVEVGTGSGFLISPQGLVVTNHHVISGETFPVLVQGQKLEVAIDVVRIEIVLPSDSPTLPARRYPASVYAVDTELDIALLNITGHDLPYVAIGDSDAVVAGDSASAIGYPLGALLELDKSDADTIPSPSVTTGAISALRTDVGGERRYLQVSATLNPGNSGGPIVDAEGYAVGIAQSRIRNASNIGFAVPINRVKRLLQVNGLDTNLPVALLAPGALIADAAKGLSIRAPGGFDDRSPLRLRVEASIGVPTTRTARGADAVPPSELALRIDRLATGQSVEQLERALLTDGVFERFTGTGLPRQSRTRNDNSRRAIVGHASGVDPTTGDQAKLVYAIVDLGKEKIVARYAGPADTIAANRSLLHASLADLEISPLLTGEVTRAVQSSWASTGRSVADGLSIPTIEGWVVEPGLAWQCATGLLRPSAGLAMSPVGDFTVALRATWHAASTEDATSTARKCSPKPGAFGETSYSARAAAWGVTYQVEGVFVHVPGSGVWQLEMITPVEKSRFVAGVFGEWIKAVAR